ncbi:biotin--[acetyl-CoA-carboxylase] ligase [Dietzia aerolata]
MHADAATVTPPGLDAAALRHALVGAAGAAGSAGAPYTSLDVVEEIGSTNAELLARAADGAPDRSVLLAEYQATGRGRLGRVWTAPPRTQVAVSVLLRPGAVTPTLFGWLPLVTGLAVRDGLRAAAGVEATLKWPNDVLVSGRKLSGILAEMTTVPAAGDFQVRLPAVVVGVGINVALTQDQLPVPHATSLQLEGGSVDRTAVARAVLEALARRHQQWRECERGAARPSPMSSWTPTRRPAPRSGRRSASNYPGMSSGSDVRCGSTARAASSSSPKRTNLKPTNPRPKNQRGRRQR